MSQLEEKLQDFKKIQTIPLVRGILTFWTIVGGFFTFFASVISGGVIFFLIGIILSIISSIFAFFVFGIDLPGDLLSHLSANLLMPFLFLSNIFGFYLYGKLLKKLDILSHIQKDMEEILRIKNETLGSQESFNEILEKIETIHTTFLRLKRMLFLRYFVTKSARIQLEELFQSTCEIILITIEDLRRDLIFRLKEKQKEHTIASINLLLDTAQNSDLSSVRELQLMRLEKQKEQFEALQKISIMQ